MIKKNKKSSKNVYKEIETLKKEFSGENIIKLISLFGHPEWFVRKKAADAVSFYGDKSIPHLSQTVFLNYSIDDDTLYWSIYCAGKIGGNGVEKILIPLFEDEKTTKNNKVFIIRALGNNKSDKIIKILIDSLGDSSWNIRKEAADQLQKFGEGIIPKLKKAFTSGNKDVRYWTIKILGNILGDGAINFLKKMLKSDNKDIRYYATAALGEINNEEALIVLTQLFSDESWLVRAQVADIFEKLGNKSVKYLKMVFENGNSDARFQVIKLMGKIMGSESISFIKKIFNSNEPEMKFYAMSALSESIDKRSIDLIISRFSDEVWLVRKHASETISKMGEVVIPYLEEILEKSFDDNMKHWTIVSLCNLGEIGSKVIDKYSKEFTKKEKIILIENSNIIDNIPFIEKLFELLGDREWPVRNSAHNKLSENFKHIKEYIPHKFMVGNADSRFWMIKIAKEHPDEIMKVLKDKLETSELPSIEELKLKAYSLVILFSVKNRYSLKISDVFFKKENSEECEYFFDLLNSEKLVSKDIFELLLKTAFTGFNKPEELSDSLVNFIKENIFLFSELVEDKIINEYSNFYPLVNLLGDIKNEKSLKLLLSLLDIDNLDIKSNVLDKIASFGSLESLFALLKFFKEGNEEEKLLLISINNKSYSNNGIKLIADQFRISTNEESSWILKLLISWGGNHKEYLIKLLTETKDPKIKKWLEIAVDHLSGR